MLYTGIVSLFKNLHEPRYNHFLDLYCGVFILLSDSASDPEWNTLARTLLRRFVDKTAEFYGKAYMIYNVHNLIHLADDALKYGNLSKVSCFPFENYMQQIKKFVRGNKHFVQQVIHRVSEIDSTSLVVKRLEKAKSKKFIVWNDVYLSSDTGDNCFITKDNRIILIINLIRSECDDVVLQVKAFKEKRRLKCYPCRSDKLGIYRLESNFTDEFSCRLSDFFRKYVLLPTNQMYSKYFALPLL